MVAQFDEVAALLWGRRPPATRGPKATLTVEGITVAAIAIADEQGMGALTMQTVAERLARTKMALYRHVPGRAELVALMIDHALGPAPEPAATGGWRDRVMAWADQVWRVHSRHPWLVEAMIGYRPLGPNELAWIEHAVAILEDTGLTGPERLDTVYVLAGHIRNTVQHRVTAQGVAGAAEDEEYGRFLARLLVEDGDRYPALAAAAADSVPEARDNGLRFGLDRILDGVEALMARRP